MKSRNGVAIAGGTTREASQPDLAEEATKQEPTPEEIRKRAFEIHIERGGIHGCDLDDWLQAERELRSKSKNPS